MAESKSGREALPRVCSVCGASWEGRGGCVGSDGRKKALCPKHYARKMRGSPLANVPASRSGEELSTHTVRIPVDVLRIIKSVQKRQRPGVAGVTLPSFSTAVTEIVRESDLNRKSPTPEVRRKRLQVEQMAAIEAGVAP